MLSAFIVSVLLANLGDAAQPSIKNKAKVAIITDRFKKNLKAQNNNAAIYHKFLKAGIPLDKVFVGAEIDATRTSSDVRTTADDAYAEDDDAASVPQPGDIGYANMALALDRTCPLSNPVLMSVKFGVCVKSENAATGVDNSFKIVFDDVTSGTYTFTQHQYSDTACSTQTGSQSITYSTTCSGGEMLISVTTAYPGKQAGYWNFINYASMSDCSGGDAADVMSAYYLPTSGCIDASSGGGGGSNDDFYGDDYWVDDDWFNDDWFNDDDTSDWGKLSYKVTCSAQEVYWGSSSCNPNTLIFSAPLSAESCGLVQDDDDGDDDDDFGDDFGDDEYTAIEYQESFCSAGSTATGAASYAVALAVVCAAASVLFL